MTNYNTHIMLTCFSTSNLSSGIMRPWIEFRVTELHERCHTCVCRYLLLVSTQFVLWIPFSKGMTNNTGMTTSKECQIIMRPSCWTCLAPHQTYYQALWDPESSSGWRIYTNAVIPAYAGIRYSLLLKTCYRFLFSKEWQTQTNNY